MEGSFVGSTLGFCDGVVDGAHVGELTVGFCVGITDGHVVGIKVGVFDGIIVGAVEGTSVGITDGKTDGETVGTIVGDVVGPMLGCCDGEVAQYSKLSDKQRTKTWFDKISRNHGIFRFTTWSIWKQFGNERSKLLKPFKYFYLYDA